MKSVKSLMVVAVVMASATAAMADSILVFDRGLPTANLNNAAEANRSNVAWADYSPYQGENWAIGDDFNLGKSGQYNVTDLRIWLIGTDSTAPSVMWTDLTLFGGGTTSASVTPLSTVSTAGNDPNVTFNKVNYVGGESYQGSSGNYIYIWQVDFNLNWTVDGSATNTFFLGGTPTALNKSLYGSSVSPFMHASNAGLSGSTQQGADNSLYDLMYNDSYTATGMDSFSSLGNGWDKASDINVQVFAAPVPLPAAVGVGFSMLGGFGLLAGLRKGLRRRARIA